MKTTLRQMHLIAFFCCLITSSLVAQSYSGGAGTYGDPYHIATKADLKYLSENSGEWSKYFIQTANIVFSASDFESGGDFYNSGAGWIPIGTSGTSFNGIYDGGGYSISNLYINRGSTDYVGFIGNSGGNEIKNINLINVDITGQDNTGGLLGNSYGDLISKCRTTGTVSGRSNVGGLIGYRSNPQTMSTSYSSCTVTGSQSYTGGLIGYVVGTIFNQSIVTNCYASGPVNGNNTVAGLIGGFQYTDVTNCYSSGAVSGSSNLYGLCGYADALTVTNSYWDQTTSGRASSAGGGTGKTTAEMKTQSTYTGFNFSTIWQISGSNYPTLQGFAAIGYTINVNAASNVGTTSATLSGVVHPASDTAAVWFLYGTTSSVYTDSAFAVPDTVSGDSTTNVALTLSGLAQTTTYYYTISVMSSDDYRRGSEKSFTTSSELWGSALSFTSSNTTYAKAGGPATTATDNFTIEAWVKWDGTNTGGVQMIASNGYAGSDGYGIYLWSDNRLAFLISGKAWLQSVGTTLDADNWNHVALVRNGGTWSLYKDGTSLSLGGDSPTFPYTPNTNFFVGGDSLGYKFNGVIDEIRVSNVARYTSNFTAPTEPFTTDGNTAVLYHLNEGTGSTSADAGGGGNNLSLVNSPVWIGSDNPLPVELVSFTASTKHNGVELQWYTASELNNHGFEVEKKEVRGSGLEENSQITNHKSQTSNQMWVKIGFVDGNGTSNSPQSYSFVDASARGRVQYRLKQIDRDGSFSYSPEVEVIVGSALKAFALEQNYPNPFNPSTTIGFTLQVSGLTTLKIYDAIGREAATLVHEELEAGVYHQKTFEASNFASGMYFARLQSGTNIQIKKMILLK